MKQINKYLGTDYDELYNSRVQSLCGDLEAASEDVIRNLEKNKRDLLRKREVLLDLGVKNRQDVSVIIDINAEKWAAELHGTALQSHLLEKELEIAKATHRELFTEEV